MLFESNSFEKFGTIRSIKKNISPLKKKSVQKVDQFEVLSEVLQEKLTLIAF